MKIILILAILFVFIFFSLMETEKPKKTETNSKTTTDTTSIINLATKGLYVSDPLKTTETNSKNKKTTVSATAVNLQPSRWNYSTNEDRMDGSKSYFAHLTSNNMLLFKFMNTYSWFQLTIRNKNKKNEVILLMMKETAGQFMPSHYSPYKTCRVKFDENSPINFGYSSSISDGSSNMIFFFNEQKFIANLKKAEKVMIECEFFQEGKKIIEFNVNGLEWNR